MRRWSRFCKRRWYESKQERVSVCCDRLLPAGLSVPWCFALLEMLLMDFPDLLLVHEVTPASRLCYLFLPVYRKNRLDSLTAENSEGPKSSAKNVSKTLSLPWCECSHPEEQRRRGYDHMIRDRLGFWHEPVWWASRRAVRNRETAWAESKKAFEMCLKWPDHIMSR